MNFKEQKLFYGENAREILREGVNLLGHMVGATLGAGGKLVVIGQESMNPTTTKDGVTVAKNVRLDSPYDLGANMVKMAANRLHKRAGDGTTTATVMAQALINNGFNMLEKKRIPVRTLVSQLNAAKDSALLALEKQRLVKGDGFRIQDIIEISTNSDSEITNLIYKAYEEVGDHGLILVEESKTQESFLQLKDGYAWDSTLITESFMNDKTVNYIKFENPLILLYDKKVEQIEPLKDILMQAHDEDRPIVIIAEDFDTQVIQLLIMNNQRGILKCAAIKAPGYGSLRDENLNDIAAITGATLITANVGLSIRDVRYDDLGTCGSLTIKHDSFIIQDPNIDKERLASQIAQAKLQVNINKDHTFLEDLYAKRLARLTNSSVNIMVGGLTELEVKEKMDRYDDAIKALIIAIKHGIVPGGGVALLRSQVTENPGDYGATLLNKALFEPFKMILFNANINDNTLKDTLTKEKKYYKLNKDTLLLSLYDNVMDSGCIDPYEVTKEVIITSVSVAISILLTEGIIVRPAIHNNMNLDEIPMG